LNKKWLISSGIVIVLLIVMGGLSWMYGWFNTVETAKMADGTQLKFRTQGEQFEIYQDKKWETFFPQGVNLGATLPGHYPGELPIDKETYLRWFDMMTEMGSNVVRVYTIHPPYFYEALVEYNKRNSDRPLYLIQGVWSPEELLTVKRNAFDSEITDMFQKEITDTVRAVNGDITLKAAPGKASGKFTANALPYLMAWHIGTEWDPRMVVGTNKSNKDITHFAGSHFATKDGASPFECWLADLLDLTADLENEMGYQHPITFTNWVTTDPLQHPGEPYFEEDLVSVDATHIKPMDWQAGYFASFHVYPYYPDLFRFDETLREVINEDGKADPYRTYLRRLKEYHAGMPVIVAEFGVPNSWGIGHKELLGRHQGGHNEVEQGEINAALFQAIVDEDLAGAIVFAWQDEWFKKTWNTMRLEVPEESRANWLNVLSNEQMFGIIGMYPSKDDVILVDGEPSDWDKLEGKDKMLLIEDGTAFKELWATHDEAYVYMMAKLNHPFDPDNETIYIGADTLPGGNRHAEQLSGKKLDEGLETLIALGDGKHNEIKIASNYDFHTRLYGKQYQMLPVSAEEMKDDSGVFHSWKLAVGLLMESPDTKVNYPFEDVPAGELIRGTTDPSRQDYQSLASWNTKGTTIELRIPWGLLGYSDPSSRQAISYKDTNDNTFVSETSEGIRFVPWIKEKKGSAAVIGLDSGTEPFPISELQVFRWKEWTDVKYNERKKRGYAIIKQAFQQRSERE
jgi:hypothetical protein